MTNILSPMQDTILQYFADGMTTNQISKELKISPRTVESHAVHIRRKLGVNKMIHAVYIYAKQGKIIFGE